MRRSNSSRSAGRSTISPTTTRPCKGPSRPQSGQSWRRRFSNLASGCAARHEGKGNLERKRMAEREKPARIVAAVTGADGLLRCPWPGVDPLYIAYHDEEWGAPEYDDRALFEKLVLDAFQAGLSWITILSKRPAFRAAFDGFQPERIVRWDAAKKEALMLDAGIVRNRAKIEATVALARIYLDLASKGGFSRHLWSFVDGRPIQNERKSLAELAVESEVSR